MNNISRRKFLKLANRALTVTGLAVLIGPVIAFFFPSNLEETPTEPMRIGSLAELPVGQSKIVRYGRYPALIVHTPQGLRAFSAVCTHFACVVKWMPDQREIVCPCHEASFAPTNGQVISGPPPTPLEPLPVAVVGDQVYLGGAG